MGATQHLSSNLPRPPPGAAASRAGADHRVREEEEAYPRSGPPVKYKFPDTRWGAWRKSLARKDVAGDENGRQPFILVILFVGFQLPFHIVQNDIVGRLTEKPWAKIATLPRGCPTSDTL